MTVKNRAQRENIDNFRECLAKLIFAMEIPQNTIDATITVSYLFSRGSLILISSANTVNTPNVVFFNRKSVALSL
jgi:hypothetical protein